MRKVSRQDKITGEMNVEIYMGSDGQKKFTKLLNVIIQ